MRCPHCDSDSPPGMKFCGQCGAKLGGLCPGCGAENPLGFKFCGECGSSLTAPAPHPAEEPDEQRLVPALHAYTPPHLMNLQAKAVLEGERKQVTVLFCDLVNSTGLADRLGPETMHLLLNRFFELALGEVHRYEGTVNQFLGDGFMALFGAPVTHEDHARRAAFAALGLQKAVRDHRGELSKGQGAEFKVRMGLNTGWVVVGGIGDHLRMDYTAVGDTTNLAARLQQIAEPGTIFISEATARLVQGVIHLERLEPVQIKGKADPIRPYRVLGVVRRHSEATVLSGTALSPFVGRQREMVILSELKERAASSEGQVVGIAGEAGAGKSRLLYEFRRRFDSDETLWLSGRCLSYGSGIPYLPLLFLLRSGWGIGEMDDPETVKARLRRGVEAANIAPEMSLPYLLRLLGIEEGTKSLAELSPQALQSRISTILRQMIFSAGQGRLVIIEIEDLHWIDETSEDFLDYVVEGLAPARMLLILTYRSGYRPRWIEKSYATQIALRRLTEQESRIVMEAVLRRSSLSTELTGTILSKAEGNPFFLEELTRSLMEGGSLADVSVPDTIQGVLMARIDRLPEDHKRLLQTASVLGREFALDLLAAVWGRPESLARLLSDLKRWEFVYEEPTAGEPLYFFKHALTQEAVYQSLLTSRRQTLHAEAGRAYETLYTSRLEDVYDSLAYHFSKAKDPPKAVRYLSLFAERAARGYSHAEAVKALREALEQALRLPEQERDRWTIELVLQLADSLLPLALFPETLELFLTHRDMLERLEDFSLAGRFYFWLAHTYSYLGNQDEAAANAHRAIEAARQAGDSTTEGKACYVLSRDAFWAGRFSEGIGYGLQAIGLLERAADRWWQGQAYWVAGFHHYVLGQFEEAFAAMGQAHAIWQALADPRLDPSWSIGYFHASLGDAEAGIAECQAGLERARDPLNTAVALGFLGHAYLEKGELRKAVEALEESVRQMEQTGMQQLLGWFATFLAEAYLRSGRPGEARESALRALAVTSEVRFLYGVGLAQRALGRIEQQTEGDADSAKAWFGEALKTFLSLQAPFEVGRTRLDLARAAQTGGETEEAVRQLAEAYRTFAELRVPCYVECARRLAVELDLAVPTPPSGISSAAELPS